MTDTVTFSKPWIWPLPLAAGELQLVVFIQAVILWSWWELFKKNKAMGVVPAEFFAMGYCGYKTFVWT